MDPDADPRSSLLDQLRIDRSAPAGKPRRSGQWLLGLVLLAAGSGVAAWWAMRSPAAVLVAAATAQAATAEAAAAGGSTLDASGYVVARREATVSAKITGKVVAVLVEEGQHVAKNQVVARLDDSNYRAQVGLAAAQRAEAEARLQAAQLAFTDAGPTFRRDEQQYASGVISAQAFDTAKTAYDAARSNLDVARRAEDVAAANVTVAERDLDNTIVRAPFAGVVTDKAAQQGEMVSPVTAGGGFTRTGICTIVDMRSLEVDVDVSENFIHRVHPNQKVAVRLDAYPNWRIPAHVIAIVPTADRAKATVPVRIALERKDRRILPEMGVRVSFLGQAPSAHDAPAAGAVIVPPKAVRKDGATAAVYVIDDNNTIERRAVRLGARSADGQLVLSGLTAGTRLATSHLDELSNGAHVRVVN